jgi:nucleolar protein 15
MSKFAHVAAETRKRVRESTAADEADLVRSNISAISKKAKKPVSEKTPVPATSADADLEEEADDEEDTSAETITRVRGKGKTALLKKRAAAEREKETSARNAKHAGAVSSIIYLGHIPNGFFEKEMTSFFEQFGQVKRVKLFRSEKTRGSKGYAFIQFVEPEVARTAALAIDGYFLAERQLQCHLVPASKCHRGMFARLKVKKDPNEGLDVTVPRKVVVLTATGAAEIDKKIISSLAAKQKKISAKGIDFDVSEARVA